MIAFTGCLARLGGNTPLRLGYVNVCEQQIPKFRVFKVV
jgi:hypothetical protein